MLTKLDKRILSVISRDMPLTSEPFKTLADGLGVEENLILNKIRLYKRKGLMRKFAAALNHRKVGFRHNAMVVWNIPERRVNKAGKFMASLDKVSHCYIRRRAADWDYNLYSMVHGKTKKECLDVVRAISRKTGCQDFNVLLSTREYKKSDDK